MEWQQTSAQNLASSSVPFIGLNKDLEKTQLISSLVTPQGVAKPLANDTGSKHEYDLDPSHSPLRRPLINENYGNFICRQKRVFEDRRVTQYSTEQEVRGKI